MGYITRGKPRFSGAELSYNLLVVFQQVLPYFSDTISILLQESAGI